MHSNGWCDVPAAKRNWRCAHFRDRRVDSGRGGTTGIRRCRCDSVGDFHVAKSVVHTLTGGATAPTPTCSSQEPFVHTGSAQRLVGTGSTGAARAVARAYVVPDMRDPELRKYCRSACVDGRGGAHTRRVAHGHGPQGCQLLGIANSSATTSGQNTVAEIQARRAPGPPARPADFHRCTTGDQEQISLETTTPASG